MATRELGTCLNWITSGAPHQLAPRAVVGPYNFVILSPQSLVPGKYAVLSSAVTIGFLYRFYEKNIFQEVAPERSPELIVMLDPHGPLFFRFILDTQASEFDERLPRTNRRRRINA